MESPDASAEETTAPIQADIRNLYKVEIWTDDDMRRYCRVGTGTIITPDMHVEKMVFASNRLSKVKEIFADQVRQDPGRRCWVSGVCAIIPGQSTVR